ncbi:hypothetical protein [Hydrocarboniphaga effusa]|jgi:hypothetical protein|uniref:hypothetical protein n=1 Tax=Hydrocarboniphaga effusa TaxID=243629 RepID=UPI003BAB112B
MKLPSFHDDHVVGYEVNVEARRIVLKIKAAQGSSISSVVFNDIARYCFVNDALGNIVYALEQVRPGDVILEFKEQIAESYRQSGAPGPWAGDLTTASRKLEEQGISGFVLSSSFGMSGWVLAANAAVVLAQPTLQADGHASGVPAA